MRVLSLLIVLLFGAQSFAGMVGAVRLDRGPGWLGGVSGGGEFRLEVADLGADGNTRSNERFLNNYSYCLELSEGINLGVWYKYVITDSTYQGGVAGWGGDLLDDVSAKIYNQWVANRTNDAGSNAVQAALWKTEEGSYGTSNATIQAAADALIANPGSNAANVRVMNIFAYSASTAALDAFVTGWSPGKELDASLRGDLLKQDQIIKVDPVPEPGSAILFALGCLSMASVRVRSKRRVA